jgi:spermidine synthase
MRVRTGDARVTIRDLPSHSYDLVIGDAFAGLAIPWHLTTREAIEDVRRTLRAGGSYGMNIIDHPPLEFLRAEVRTLTGTFGHVALIARPSLDAGVLGTSNYVLVASDSEAPIRRLRARIAARGRGDALVAGRRLQRFIGGAPLLTDDYAPADQLLTR